MPLALQLPAVEVEFQMAFLQAELGIEVGRPRALVPDHDCAGAVVAFRTIAFEVFVIIGMVLYQHCEALVSGIQRWAFGNGPTLQHTVHFKAKIIMEP